jgi:hypothetical protein
MMLDVHDEVKVPPPEDEDASSPRWRLPLPGRSDGGRRDDEGGSGGGGHTAKARREGKFDVRNSWQVILGSILIPLGVVFILLGWYGAAHARVVQQQIPYMVSGSFVGLGCMIVGGLCYWGHWLYRLYDQADMQHEEQLRVLEVIAASLATQQSAAGRTGNGSGAPVADAPDGGGVGGVGTADRSSEPVYATAAGTVYHRAGCAVIAHHPDDLRVLGAEGRVGLRPCQICQPDG